MLEDESIQHLFFECHVEKTVWNAVFFAFGIKPPTSIANMLGSWPRGSNGTLENIFWQG